MVDHVLALAATWTAWDGRPRPVDDRVYTPHKAIRRVAGHLVGPLAELEDGSPDSGRSPAAGTRRPSPPRPTSPPSPGRTSTRRAAG
ncbi:hypothetical protein ACFSL4_11330 [Streptomyces caeni]|uniref:Uncharacterized protein n=1 Tax=Streptomyces caeni TaxID=2307231 RepID=A0ABW4IN68_9ACTN